MGVLYSYGGSNRPSGPIGRARAHSDTLVYLSNIAKRGVYILHGDADDNVPVTEGRNMFAQAQMVTDDVVYFEQPGGPLVGWRRKSWRRLRRLACDVRIYANPYSGPQ